MGWKQDAGECATEMRAPGVREERKAGRWEKRRQRGSLEGIEET